MIIFILSETPFSCLKIIMWTLRTNNPKLESHQNGSCLDSFISIRVCVCIKSCWNSGSRIYFYPKALAAWNGAELSQELCPYSAFVL